MRQHIARPGDCCASCQSLAWGGERYVTGRLGVHCQECWDRDWEHVRVSALTSLLERVQRAYAKVSELEAVAARFPGDEAILANIASIRRDAEKLENRLENDTMGVTDRLWDVKDVVALIEEKEAAEAPKVRGPYKKKAQGSN